VAPYSCWHGLRPFSFLFTLEYFLDCFKDLGVRSLHYAIGLWVVYQCECDLRSNLLAEIFEHCIVKLLCVVDCYMPVDAIAADDVLPEEFSD
jgi:hypothetical protein